MPTKTPTDLDSLIASFQAAGLPVEDWLAQLNQKRSEDPSFEARPFEKIQPSKYGKIKKLKPGYHETMTHPHWGWQVPRCQAAKKRSGGQQCGQFAIKGRTTCRVHGGRAGILTPEGRARQIASVTKHGRETCAIRAERSEQHRIMKELDRLAKEHARLETEARGPRGTYAKDKSAGSHKQRKPKSDS